MEIKESKIFEMTATIMAGVMANPGNAILSQDAYGQQTVFLNVYSAVEQAMVQKGVGIVPD